LVADIGGTNITLGHVRDGVPAKDQVNLSSDVLRVIDPAAALTKELQTYADQRGLEIASAVLGVPTSLTKDLTTIPSSPNIAQLAGRAFGVEVGALLNAPVHLERDINLLLLGEARAGSAQGSTSTLGVFFGTGVGAAWLHGTSVHRGSSGAGLELGHIPMRGDGAVCVCGNTDCLEAYACGHTLRQLAQEHGLEVSRLFAERHQHPALDARLHTFTRDQAYALAAAIHVLDPEVVVVGGGVLQMREYPLEKLFETVRAHLRTPDPRGSVQLRQATLGRGAALYGALSVLEARGAAR
jgi:allose kinase